MKSVTYRLIDGTDQTIAYDEAAPCWSCGEPVVEASMGGTVLCPWCDCGITRAGRKWTLAEAEAAGERFRAARAAASPGGETP